MDPILKSSQEILKEWDQRLEKAEDKAKELSMLTQELSAAQAYEYAEQFMEQAKTFKGTPLEAGLRQLHQDEHTYYQNLTAGVTGAKQEFDPSILLPTTVVNKVFEDLKKDYPLLKKINTIPAGVTKWMVSDFNDLALWGDFDDAIVKEIAPSVKEIDMESKRLTAFLMIPKGLVELGYEWLDRYIREVLAEAMYKGLEEGIINGTGKSEPIGILKDLDNSINDEYQDKEAVSITSFSPTQYAKAIQPLTQDGENDISGLDLIIHPDDYLTILMPSVAYQTDSGAWVVKLPISTNIITSTRMPKGKAVVGFLDKYMLGLSKTDLNEYREIAALQDKNVWIAKAYGNGRPMNNKCFAVLDISTVITETAAVNYSLASSEYQVLAEQNTELESEIAMIKGENTTLNEKLEELASTVEELNEKLDEM